MIQPTKHLSIKKCLLGSGYVILEELRQSNTVSSLWEKVKKLPEIMTYEKYVLTLAFLYSINLIKYENGLLWRCQK